MIHYLYVGHFEKDGGAKRLAKRPRDGAPRPVVVGPLDLATVQELLEEKGVEGTRIPDDWRLAIEDEGYVVCDAYTPGGDARDFIRQLATRTGCDVLYDGMIAFSPDELTLARNESERRAVGSRRPQ